MGFSAQNPLLLREWVFARMGIRENGFSGCPKTWILKNMRNEILRNINFVISRFSTSGLLKGFPTASLCLPNEFRPRGVTFALVWTAWQHFKLMKEHVSAEKGLNTDFQLLVQKLERRGVLFSGLLPPTGGTKTGRKTTFRAHLSYICVKLQICVLQKKSLKKRSNLAKLLVLPSHVRLSSGSLFVLCSGCLVLFIKVQICFS